jgi:hypothetical protein
MNLVKFKVVDGEEIMVNPECVAAVGPSVHPERCFIELSSGRREMIERPYKEAIWELLTADRED